MLSAAEEKLLAEFECEDPEGSPLRRTRRTALHRAAEGGFCNIVAYLLIHKPSLVAAEDSELRTALHFAAQGGHDEIVAQLLAHMPALADGVMRNGFTALHLAARGGHDKVVEQLLRVKPELVNMEDHFRVTAMYDAAKKGHVKVVEQQLWLADASQLQPIMNEAAESGQGSIVALLFAVNPALVDGVNGETPLHIAAKHGQDEIVAQLLALSPQSGNARDFFEDRTALHFAALRGHDKIVAQLLAHSPALIYAVDSFHKTALYYAAANGHESTVVQLLNHSPDSIDAKCREGNVLHAAASGNHAKVIAELLTRRPSLADEVDFAGRTPLFRAAHESHQKAVDSFLLTPMQVHHRDGSGNTLLHLVIGESFGRSFSHALIKRVWELNPAALFVHDRYGRSPLDRALQPFHAWAVEYFQLKLSMEQIEKALANLELGGLKHGKKLREVVEGECERPLLLLLPRVCVSIVFEYVRLRKPSSDNALRIMPKPRVTSRSRLIEVP